jgi:hypothetical protein
MRLHPEVAVKKYSPNISARSRPISIIVLHSTESANVPHSDADLEGVASWFASTASQVSAHVIVDADGHSARCVSDHDKAWACMGFNSPSLNIEQIGRAAQSSWPRAELIETARWIAQWSHEHEIPIREAHVADGGVVRSGITTHAALGAGGGGHHDPGAAYPLEEVLHEARRIKRLRYG